MTVLFVYMSAYYIHAWCPQRPGLSISGTGVKGGCELLCGCWERTPGSLEERQVLLHTEPPLQPQVTISFMRVCRGQLGSPSSPSPVWVLEVELTSSGLVTSTIPC